MMGVSSGLFQQSGYNEFTPLSACCKHPSSAAEEGKHLPGSNFAAGWKSEAAVSAI